MHEYMNDFESRLKEVSDWLTNEYSAIRTGQATPALLDGVKVESYGSLMAINQVASVGVEDARTLRVSPWDATVIKSLETAIRDADLGVSVIADSSGLRIIFPELTGERRLQLLKIAKSKLEDARVSVRAARDEAMKDIDKREKDGDISEDDKFTEKENVQKKVDTVNRILDGLYEKKELEINK
jgi:ribosome recycling factor